MSGKQRGCRLASLVVFTASLLVARQTAAPAPPATASPATRGSAEPNANKTDPHREQLGPNGATNNGAPGKVVVPPGSDNAAGLPIEFQSHGLNYEALTKNGITVMFAALPQQIKDFSIVQVTITNGSLISWTTKASDFSFERQDGGTLPASTADDVVESLLERASRSDVIKLQLLYENSIYALANYRPTNGYEQRREAAMAQFVNLRFSAAAAASAIVLAPVKLKPGDSTDGAVFFELHGKEKSLGTGVLVGRTCGETFIFQVAAEPKGVH